MGARLECPICPFSQKVLLVHSTRCAAYNCAKYSLISSCLLSRLPQAMRQSTSPGQHSGRVCYAAAKWTELLFNIVSEYLTVFKSSHVDIYALGMRENP